MLTIWVLMLGLCLGFAPVPIASAQEADAAAETEEAPAEEVAEEPAEEEAEEIASYEEFAESDGFAVFTVNNLWICISAALVFIMHLGFTTVEAGLTQKKNAVNIIFKNVWIVCSGVLLYAFWGFNAMYPTDWLADGVFAMGSWFGGSLDDLSSLTTPEYNPGYTWWGDFIFQAMFAATGATIVFGCCRGTREASNVHGFCNATRWHRLSNLR